MYYENHTFPLYEVPQTVKWGKQDVTILATQLSIKNWDDFILDIYYDIPTEGDDHANYTELPPIAALYLDEVYFFTPRSNRMLHYRRGVGQIGDVKVSISVSPHLPDNYFIEKAALGEVFIPQAPLGLADSWTIVNKQNCHRQSLDRIDFTYKSNNWIIRKLKQDEHYYQLTEYLMSGQKVHQEAKESIVLQTELEYISKEDFIEDASDICALLSIALGTQVTPHQFSIRNDDKLLPFQTKHFLPKQQSIWGPLRQGPEQHMLSPFIENAQSVFLQDPVWWRNTAHWFSRALMSKDIDTGNLIFALLFDRLYKYCEEHDKKSRRSSKVAYIQRLAYLRDRFKTSFDIKRFKKIRNQIVHEGQPDTDFPAGAIAFGEVSTAMGTILCRLLGYQGMIHPHPSPQVN